MKKLAIILFPAVVAVALVLAACGKTPGGTGGNSTPPPSGPVTTIGLASATFSTESGTEIHSATVKVNTPITFDDTINGGSTHIVCVGTGTGGTNTCDASGNGPSALYGSGVTFSAGTTSGPTADKQQFTFPNTGTYHIICTVHSGMYVDVTVTS